MNGSAAGRAALSSSAEHINALQFCAGLSELNWPINQCRINANRGPWQLFARGPLRETKTVRLKAPRRRRGCFWTPLWSGVNY